MRAFTEGRTDQTPDQIWVCEHPPVYTLGLAGRLDHVLDARDIPVVHTNRGGQVTYHGPGQVIAYPLIDLKRLGIYVKEYVYRIEQSVLKTLEQFGVTGHRVAGAPGIYVNLHDPLGHAALTGPRIDQPALHLSRGGAQCVHGPRTFYWNRPVRICRTANGGPFYNRGSVLDQRSRRGTGRQARKLFESVMRDHPHVASSRKST
jgi:hypothetical protein